MAGLTNLVGALLNSGMISSGKTRIDNALDSSGLKHTMRAVNKSTCHTNTDANSNSNFLGSLIKAITSVLGVGRKSLSAKGALHGREAMAMLAGLAFHAFKNINRRPVGMHSVIGGNETPLGLRAPVNSAEEKELEQTATLIIKGMINAAKVDSQMGNEEIHNIIDCIRESDSDMQQLIFEEMQLPLNLDSLVNEIPNEVVAAQVYAASLFAIEVDTPVEREYLEQFVQRTGLDAEVAQQLQTAVGVGGSEKIATQFLA